MATLLFCYKKGGYYMANSINQILTNVDDFVWGVPLMVLILAGGILLTLRLGILQIENFLLL